MAQFTERVKVSGQTAVRKFTYLKGSQKTPWAAAFPHSPPLGYWQAFGRRCAQIGQDGFVDEETARRVWLSILKDYEEYTKLGMWIPDDALEEHRKVAQALGWL
ncbi:MAG: hypothetical protein JRN52_00500 [Nitrososphaerota archaeon]|nr:hypothetical protein [Nitrososphaerota archaeon]